MQKGWVVMESMTNKVEARTVTCCFCGRVIPYWVSNNPYPVNKDPDARCCDMCNDLKVIPARLKRLMNGREQRKEV